MKLEGITVLDLSLFLPGPAATQMMADHGARVIKVENPNAPEPTRSATAFPWTQGGHTVMFRATQRGKESIAIDLKSDSGKATLRALVEKADVLVEAFRPGVMARLGFDDDTVRAINPRIVYCSISAFGQSGPWRNRPAHDTATVAAAGALSVSRSPEDANAGPAIVGVAMSDMLSSHLALSGILMALLRRQQTGKGDYVDISMHESVLAASPNIVGPAFGGDAETDRFTERSLGGGAMLNIYRTADNRFIALGGGEHKFVQALFDGLGRPDFIEPVTGPAGAGHEAAIQFLRDTFRSKTRAEWEAWLAERDICWSAVVDLKEAWNSEQVWARNMRVRDSQGNDHIGIPIKFSQEAGRVNPDLPDLGQHTSAILDELNLDASTKAAVLRAMV